MSIMRTTIRLDDDTLQRLKAQAHEENVSLTRLVNRTLRAGLQSRGARKRKLPLYREQVRSMGTPRLTLDKALAVAAALEDEEVLRELALRK